MIQIFLKEKRLSRCLQRNQVNAGVVGIGHCNCVMYVKLIETLVSLTHPVAQCITGILGLAWSGRIKPTFPYVPFTHFYRYLAAFYFYANDPVLLVKYEHVYFVGPFR
jgi:hypothetical protein